MTAEITIAGTDDPQAELVSLRRWLMREDDFRGRVDFAPAPINEGELGAAQEILLALIAAGGFNTLCKTVAVWLKTRRSELEIRVTDENGRTVRITARGPVADGLASDE